MRQTRHGNTIQPLLRRRTAGEIAANGWLAVNKCRHMESLARPDDLDQTRAQCQGHGFKSMTNKTPNTRMKGVREN
jgi:hypothetical protein